MSEIKHTPGPWTANPLESDAESNLIFASTLANGTRRLVASVTTGGDAPANRRLIAAAPEMLAMLIDAVDCIKHICCSDNSCKPMMDLSDYESVIAKATGSQS